MEIGLFMPPGHGGDSLDDLVQQTILAENIGFDFVGLGDSQSIFKELYVSLTIAARATETIGIGPCITNPITRHPVVTASAIRTLGEVAHGRIRLGIGTGDSAVYTLGKKPAPLSEFEDCLTTIRSLLEGKSEEFDEHVVRLKWHQQADHQPEIPIWVAAQGPKTQKLAGKIADGVFLDGGLHPQILRRAIDNVDEGAKTVGRNPSEIKKWTGARANIGDKRETAIDEIKFQLAANANHVYRATFEDKFVPQKYRDKIKTLQEEYNPDNHESIDESSHENLIDELGLTEFLADRFAIVGTASDCRKQLRELESVEGLDGVLIPVYSANKSAFIEEFGELAITNS